LSVINTIFGGALLALHTAKTEFGIIEGLPAGNPSITVFKGIPFAAPPVGKLRWKPPEVPKPWDSVLKAYKFSNLCPQQLNSEGKLKSETPPPFEELNEDCLYLNIWTPAETTDDKLPVLFWIHGGANVHGHGHSVQFDGEGFAKRGVILVTFNWRVNIFGWLVHKELSKEAKNNISGNYALLDQAAALVWVKNNINAFGGNPECITVAGESAGASSTQLMSMTPLTKGLFKSAIMQSGGSFDLFASKMVLTLEEAEKFVDINRAMGVSSIEEARQLDAMEIIRRINRAEAAGAYLPLPVSDGHVLPGTMAEIALENRYHKINYMIGYTADETGMYDMPFDREGFIRDQREEYGGYAEEYLKCCDFLQDDNEMKAHLKVRSAELLKTGALVWAELLEEQGNKPAWVYCFSRRLPGDDAGAYHSSELWYLFQTLNRNWRPFIGADYELSGLMADYWSNFVKTGNPNGQNHPEWSPHTTASPLTMDLCFNPGMKNMGENSRVDFRKKFVLRKLSGQV
jgi:para-nitrobenzyl esterase